jgi:hypothetical protein
MDFVSARTVSPLSSVATPTDKVSRAFSPVVRRTNSHLSTDWRSCSAKRMPGGRLDFGRMIANASSSKRAATSRPVIACLMTMAMNRSTRSPTMLP